MPSPERPFLDARIVSGILVAAGIVAAVFIGNLIGNGDIVLTVFILGVAAAGTLLLLLRQQIWLLIPTFWYITGNFASLPFSVRDLAVLGAFGAFILLLALRAIRAHAKTEFLDLVVILNCGYLITVFLRNPVGFAAAGSGMVGGRPYVESLIGLMAYVVLTRVTLSPDLGRRIPVFACLPQLGVSVLGGITHFLPATVPVIGRIYTGIDSSQYVLQESGVETAENDVSRITALLGGSEAGIIGLLSYFPALTLLSPVRPLRFGIFLTCCIGIALAGFRNAIAYIGFAFVLATYFRCGVRHAMIVLAAGLLVLLGLVAVHHAGFSLPVPAQRALSFLPGDWSDEAKSDAEGSSEWRFEMWDVVLHDNTYIQNKLLGDGFGFSNLELQIMEEEQYGGQGFIGSSRQESFLIQGAFHNGPLSAIRYVGIVGLILYVFLLLSAACYAWKVIIRSRGTDFLPLALFVGLPAIYEPFQYVLIFGGFDSGFPNTLFVCGMLKLVTKGLDDDLANVESGRIGSGGMIETRAR